MITVKKMHQIASQNEIPLLSSYAGEWWQEYVENYTVFDTIFTKMFKTFEYFDQESGETEEEITADFIDAVYAWLMMNDKKYSELYRIHVIPDDEAYALTNNYDLHETYSGTSTGASSTITGQRTDVTYDNMGSQNASNVNKVTGYNSSAENTNDSSDSTTGSREDTHQFTKGQEQDTARSQGTDGHTLRRWGNIGVMTIEDILQKHANLWESFSFYKIVFDDICKNFLLIGRM